MNLTEKNEIVTLTFVDEDSSVKENVILWNCHTYICWWRQQCHQGKRDFILWGTGIKQEESTTYKHRWKRLLSK